MRKIPLDIVSGFLGAGKTTLILKMLQERTENERIFILENEYGKSGIDGILLSNSKAEIKEIYSGCICCSLKGEFTHALREAISSIKPERILIEPTGVGKLSEVLQVVNQACFCDTLLIDHVITVVDVHQVPLYLKNFGEFYKDQIRYAKIIVFSKTQEVSQQEVQEAVNIVRGYNSSASIVTTSWEQLTIQQILQEDEFHESIVISEPTDSPAPRSLAGRKKRLSLDQGKHHSGADIFESFSWEGPQIFSVSALKQILEHIGTGQYGQILRAKGLVAGEKDWLHFEYINGRWECNPAKPHATGRAVFIGQNLFSEQLLKLIEGSNAKSC